MPRYAVMLKIRNGTFRFVDNAWEFVYTLITWVVEDDFDVAEQTRRDLLAGDPLRKEIVQAYIEERS